MNQGITNNNQSINANNYKQSINTTNHHESSNISNHHQSINTNNQDQSIQNNNTIEVRLDSNDDTSINHNINGKLNHDIMNHDNINHFENEIANNELKINEMQSFLQGKYQQISELQKYLIEQFQNIQNCKVRNKNIKNCILMKIIPSINYFKTSIQTLSNLIFPSIYNYTTNIIEIIVSKTSILLSAKNQQILQLNQQIISLRQQISQPKQQNQQNILQMCQNTMQKQLNQNQISPIKIKPIGMLKQINPKTESNKINPHDKISEIYWPKEKNQNDLEQNSNRIKQCNSMTKIKATRFEIQNNKQNLQKKSISPNYSRQKNRVLDETSKYEEYYNKIKGKRVTENAKYQKILIIEDSDQIPQLVQTKSMKKIGEDVKKSLKEDFNNKVGDRKQYIKQKIQKIKTKTDARQYRREGFYQGYLK